MSISCPFCSSRDATELYRVKAAEAAAHFLPAFVPGKHFDDLRAHLMFLWGGDECSVMRCGSCKGCFANPLIAGDSKFYDIAYRYSYGYPQDRWEYHRVLSEVRERRLDSVRVLELGSGEGAFLRLLLTHGVRPENICVLEYSAEGREKISRLSAAIRCASAIETIQSMPRQSFDLVVAFQVVEHLDNAYEHLLHVSELLAPEGWLCFSVPNPERIEFSEANGGLLDMPPNHVLRLSVQAIEALLPRANLEVLRIEDEPFEFVQAFKELLLYRYKRSAQRMGTLQRRIDALGHWRIARKLLASITIAASVPSTLARMRGRKDGGARLVVARRKTN